MVLQREVQAATEREKRKDQLLDLQRSKEERFEGEVGSLRQVTQQHQHDYAMMQTQLQSAKDRIVRLEAELDAQRQTA